MISYRRLKYIIRSYHHNKCFIRSCLRKKEKKGCLHAKHPRMNAGRGTFMRNFESKFESELCHKVL